MTLTELLGTSRTGLRDHGGIAFNGEGLVFLTIFVGINSISNANNLTEICL